MRNQRSFSLEFKRQVVEELFSGESRPDQLCRRYNISSSLLYHWKRQYSQGRFNNEPTEEAALKDRIANCFLQLPWSPCCLRSMRGVEWRLAD